MTVVEQNNDFKGVISFVENCNKNACLRSSLTEASTLSHVADKATTIYAVVESQFPDVYNGAYDIRIHKE